MEEIQQRRNSLFTESAKNHQRLINILVKAGDEVGISILSQAEMSKLMNRSMTWVRKAIKRLNIEGTCISMIAPGKYVVHYTNILEQGVFSEILKLIIDSYNAPELFYTEDREIAMKRGINIKTVQMFKAYIRADLKQGLPIDATEF